MSSGCGGLGSLQAAKYLLHQNTVSHLLTALTFASLCRVELVLRLSGDKHSLRLYQSIHVEINSHISALGQVS